MLWRGQGITGTRPDCIEVHYGAFVESLITWISEFLSQDRKQLPTGFSITSHTSESKSSLYPTTPAMTSQECTRNQECHPLTVSIFPPSNIRCTFVLPRACKQSCMYPECVYSATQADKCLPDMHKRDILLQPDCVLEHSGECMWRLSESLSSLEHGVECM